MTNQTMHYEYWRHEMVMKAVQAGCKSEFIEEQVARFRRWYDVGETVDSAATTLIAFAKGAEKAYHLNADHRAIVNRNVIIGNFGK